MITLKTKLELDGLRRLGKAFSQEVEEKALREVAKPVAAGIAARIDADHHETGLTAEDIKVAVSKEGRKAGEAVVLIGASAGRSQATLGPLEFGTFQQPATPVVGPEFHARKGYFLPAVTEQLAKYWESVKRRLLGAS